MVCFIAVEWHKQCAVRSWSFIYKATLSERKTNQNKNRDPLRVVSISKRKVMGHTMVSATEALSLTLQNWQHGAIMNYE